MKTLNSIVNSVFGKIKIGLEYLFFRTGPLTMAPSQLGCWAFSHERHSRPNIEYHIQPLSLDKFGDDLHPFDAITVRSILIFKINFNNFHFYLCK